MKNIIRINLDVNERNESNIGIPLPQKVIRSKDTAVIIEMRIIGYDVNDGYTFTLLSEYTKSKRHTLYTIGDRLKIEGNAVTFVPPAELISTLEIVTNTLYIEKSGVSLDFSKFHYLAQLSEVDNTVGPVKEVYDDNYQALIDELEFKYMLIEDLTAEYVAAQVAEARVGADGTIYRFLKERLDVEHQKVTAQVGEVSNQLELTNNEIIDARGGKPTLRVRLNEIDRVDETGKHWTLIDGEWEERVGQSQLISVHGEVAWAMAEAEQAREDAVKAYEDAVAEAKRSADIEDALIRTNIQQGLSAVETELTTAKQEAKDAANQALTDAKTHADAEVQASKEHFDGLITELESEVADAQAAADSAVEQIDTAVANAGFTSLDETISNVQSISNQAQINASTAIDNAQDAMSSASTAISDASQAKADAQAAITEAGEAVDSANTAKTNAQTALADAQTALSTARNADTKSGLAEAAANTAKANAQTALDNSNTAITNAADAITKAGQAEDAANTAKTNAQTAIDDAQSALTEAGSAKTTADTLSIKVDDLEGEVELKASQTEVDGISGTVSTHTTTIGQHATAITSKADKTVVDTLSGTVTDQGTLITQNATDIKTKASQTEVDTVKGTVDDHTTEISQNATDIASKASSASVSTLTGRVSTAETTITQHATSIASKANQTEVDTVKGTVSGHTTTLSQHATAISSKAESELVDTIKGTVDTHTTEISQNATDIASKANATTVNTLTGRVDTAESNISQNATAITQRVTTTTYNTGIANKENTVLKQTTAPTHVNGRLWLDTSVTPNILKRSNGTTWIKATPTTPGEVGAYSQAAGAGLAGRLTTAETNITQTATAITSKADKSTVDTLEGIVSTQGTTITQQADLIESKANQSEVDTVKGTVAGHTTTISQHANQIASKAESNLVNAIKGTVDNHTTEISQNATDIASKANSSSVNTLTGRVSTAETTISQHATAITSKASQTEVDTVKGTVAGHTTTISQHATKIASKAESSLVNTIKGTVDTHTTDISQNATDIASKASSSSVNALTGRVSTAETGITANANAIKLKANQSTVDTLAGTVSTLGSEFNVVAGQVNSRVWSTDIESAIDGIQVGGRNLLENSGREVSSVGGREFASFADLAPIFEEHGLDEVYSLSVDLKSSNISNTNTIQVYMQSGNGTKYGFVWTNVSVTEDYQRFKFEGLTPSLIDPSQTKANLAFFGTYGTGNHPIVRNVKIEKGNKATDWTPAPEDTDAKIDHIETEWTQTFDTISSTVSGIEGQVSEQKQSLESITGTVSGHGGRLSTVEQTASGLQTTVASKADQSQVTQLANGLSSVVTDLSNVDVIHQSGLRGKTFRNVHSYYGESASLTGMIRINTPIMNSAMTTIRFTGYHYLVNKTTIDLTVSFYAYTMSSILHHSYTNRGDFEITNVQVGRDSSGRAVIFLGEPTTHWIYPAIDVEYVKISAMIPPDSWKDGWSSTMTTNTTGISALSTLQGMNTQSRITQNATNINLRVTKGDVLSQINIEADRTLIQSKKLVLDANSVVFTGSAFIPSAQIVSLHADKINAGTISSARIDAKTIVTNGLAANVVSSEHIIANALLVDKVFSNQASVDKLWAKAIWANKITAMEIDAGKITSGTINAARLNVTDLRSKILTANVIDATQINGSTALFDKLFSTVSATNRLVARGAWIESANIKSLNADKITAGTIRTQLIARNYATNTSYIPRPPHRNNDRKFAQPLDVGMYTLTFYAKADTTTTATVYVNDDQGLSRIRGSCTPSSIGIGTGWHKYTVKVNVTHFDSTDYSRLFIRVYGTATTSLISTKEFMFAKGDVGMDYLPAPEDNPTSKDLSTSGSVTIHGGNITASTIDVGAITGNLGEFINLSLKAQNSQASLSGASFRIESIANNQSYIEMSNVPEIRARSADSSMAVMGQGRTSYHYDGSERFYFGSRLNGWQNGMMIRKHHGWGIMRESDSSNGVPAKYYTVPAGYQRVAVIEALMRDPTVTEVPTGNETQFIINSNYLGRLNGYTNSTSSTIAYPWPTLRTGDLIKYAEEIPGNESGVQQVFDIWDDNNTTVSAFGVHVTFHGGYSGASDRNIKHDIKDTAVEALAHIESLTFKEFRYNQDNRYEPIGIIAQDSGILRVKSDKVESVDIQRSIMLSLKGLQELQDIVKRQEEEINEQAEEIKQLKEIINQ